MARSLLTSTTNDLISDSGSVLWSLVTGEQLEFPITLNFLKDATLKASNNYTYEAVVIEAANFEGQMSKPLAVQPDGVQNTLVVRIPEYMGVWNPATSYMQEDVVFENDKYWRLSTGLSQVGGDAPSASLLWTETVLNRVYVQFPSTLGSDWAVKASVDSPSYGFFELRVTEPDNSIFQKTWKPVRGMLQLLFSPTDVVPDL